MCDCIKQFDELMKEKGLNTRIAAAITINPGRVATYCEIITAKDDPTKRGKPKRPLATYCPMCGEKYPE